jgi:pyrroline-5-carboxylate reductase
VNITFIGGGNMARAIIGGLLNKGFAPEAIGVVEVNPEARERLRRDLGVRCFASPAQAAPFGDLLVMAVKPQQMHAAAGQVAPAFSGQLVVSIAAGTRLADLSRWLGGHRLLVRCMPNTPALIGAGVTAVYPHRVSEAQRAAQRYSKQLAWCCGSRTVTSIQSPVSGSSPASCTTSSRQCNRRQRSWGFRPRKRARSRSRLSSARRGLRQPARNRFRCCANA